MCMLFAQFFEVVWGEVDDQQLAVGLQDAPGFEQRALWLIEEVEHLMNGDEVGHVVGKGQGEDVGLAQLCMAEAVLLQIGAGNGQHLAARIDAVECLGARSEEFEHAARACAEIDQRIEGFGCGEIAHGALDACLVDVQ